MNLDLIELQLGCPATAVIVTDENYKKLPNALAMRAGISNKSLFGYPYGSSIFKSRLDDKSRESIVYFVIMGIDDLSYTEQNKYLGMVKDREFNGYNLPKNCIIVFTVKSREYLKKIAPELYHYCVVV